MAKPFAGEAGYRTVVRQDETAMVLDPSLPPPWWPNHQYTQGDLVVWEHRFYRCRTAIIWTGNFYDDQHRPCWIEITGGVTDIRDMVPDAVGADGQTVTAKIDPNHRLYVDTRNGPVNITLPMPGVWANGDIIEIVDDYRSFDKHPCTLIANGVRINFVDPDPGGEPGNAILAVVGIQDYWRFTYYSNPADPTDQWLYILSAPTAAAGGGTEPDRTVPISVVGATDFIVKPNNIIIARTGNGPINFTPDEDAFTDGDTFTIIDVDWTFDKVIGEGDGVVAYQGILKPTPKITYQDADPDGNFYLNIVGPASGWQFFYYAGRVMCYNMPLSQAWINYVSDSIAGPQEQTTKAAVAAVDPAPEPVATMQMAQPLNLFTTVAVDADVDLAEPWTQYDCSLGRKKSLTVYLPPDPKQTFVSPAATSETYLWPLPWRFHLTGAVSR